MEQSYMQQMTVQAFIAHARRLRPVWTITWRDLSAPSLRSGTPPVTDEDLWYNKQIAQDYYDEYGLTLLGPLTKYISKCRNLVEYRVSHPGYSRGLVWLCSTNTVTIRTPEKTALQYLLNLLTSTVVVKPVC